jgi:hypothetical protein
LGLCNELLEFLENEGDISNRKCVSNEGHFHLDDYLNKQNSHYWALQNSEIGTDNSLHTKKINSLAYTFEFWHILTYIYSKQRLSPMEICKGKVFNTNPNKIDDLKDATQQKGFSISADTLQDHITRKKTHQTCCTLRTYFLRVQSF